MATRPPVKLGDFLFWGAGKGNACGAFDAVIRRNPHSWECAKPPVLEEWFLGKSFATRDEAEMEAWATIDDKEKLAVIYLAQH
jgi:hypothetical protein